MKCTAADYRGRSRPTRRGSPSAARAHAYRQRPPPPSDGSTSAPCGRLRPLGNARRSCRRRYRSGPPFVRAGSRSGPGDPVGGQYRTVIIRRVVPHCSTQSPPSLASRCRTLEGRRRSPPSRQRPRLVRAGATVVRAMSERSSAASHRLAGQRSMVSRSRSMPCARRTTSWSMRSRQRRRMSGWVCWAYRRRTRRTT